MIGSYNFSTIFKYQKIVYVLKNRYQNPCIKKVLTVQIFFVPAHNIYKNLKVVELKYGLPSPIFTWSFIALQEQGISEYSFVNFTDMEPKIVLYYIYFLNFNLQISQPSKLITFCSTANIHMYSRHSIIGSIPTKIKLALHCLNYFYSTRSFRIWSKESRRTLKGKSQKDLVI